MMEKVKLPFCVKPEASHIGNSFDVNDRVSGLAVSAFVYDVVVGTTSFSLRDLLLADSKNQIYLSFNFPFFRAPVVSNDFSF